MGKRQWRSRCQFGVWSHPLDFPSMWTTAHGVGPRCGRSLSCVYTGCLVIKSPYGVVSVTSYTSRSQSVWEWGGDPLSEPYRIAVVMTFRGPPHDTIKILSLLPTVMDSMENLCRSKARYLTVGRARNYYQFFPFDSKYSLANLLQRISTSFHS